MTSNWSFLLYLILNLSRHLHHLKKMSNLRVIMHPVKKEFKRNNLSFDHTFADDFVKSQWQSRTKSTAYLIYRWVIALFFFGVVVDSMVEQASTSTSFWLYFIYLTNWGVMLCMLTNLLGAALVTTWHCHPEYEDKIMNMQALTSPFCIYWGMHTISLVLSIVITIIYWTLLYNANESELNVTNILTHALNSMTMFLDLLIVAHPLRLLHACYPLGFGTFFAFFSIIYHICGGKNKKGEPYIYHVINWSQPLASSLVVVAVLLFTCFIHFMLFIIYKLRAHTYRRIHKASYCISKTATPKVDAEKAQKNGNGTLNGTGVIHHSPSGISMVLGNYSTTKGCTNQGFTVSSEVVNGKF